MDLPSLPDDHFVYVASPYSHKDPAVRQARYEKVMSFVAYLTRKRIRAYSPILHCHPIAVAHELPTDHVFWRDYNHVTIKRLASHIFVCCIPGWFTSSGVIDEISVAQEKHIPVYYLVL